MRGAVGGVVEGHVAVRMELGLLEDRRLVALRGEREQRRLFSLLEARQGRHMSRAVIAGPGDVEGPVTQVLIGLVDVAEDAPGESVALDVMDTILDLALVCGGRESAGGDREAVVLRAGPVGALDLGIQEAGAGDCRLKIVDDYPADDAIEELPGVDVTGDPRLDRLIEDELGIDVAAVGEDHDEGRRAADLARRRLEEAAGIAEVHLRLIPSGNLDADEGFGRRRSLTADESIDPGVAPLKLVLVPEDLEDGAGFHPLLVEAKDLGAVRLHRRNGPGNRLRKACLERGLDVRQAGQLRLIQPARLPSELLVLPDGLSMDDHIPADLPDR